MATTIVGAVIAKGFSPFSVPTQEEAVGSAKTESAPSMLVETEESSADSLYLYLTNPYHYHSLMIRHFLGQLERAICKMAMLETQTVLPHCHFHTIVTNVQS